MQPVEAPSLSRETPWLRVISAIKEARSSAQATRECPDSIGLLVGRKVLDEIVVWWPVNAQPKVGQAHRLAGSVGRVVVPKGNVGNASTFPMATSDHLDERSLD